MFKLGLILLILSGCKQVEEETPFQFWTEEATFAPTPTLVEGLPTATPVARIEIPGASTENDRTPAPSTPSATSTTPSTATATPTPSPTPLPEQRIIEGNRHLTNQDYNRAAVEFQLALQSGGLDISHQRTALLGLGRASLELGQFELAADSLSQLISGVVGPGQPAESLESVADIASEEVALDAYFFLAQVYEDRGQCSAAIRAYESYLNANPELGAYIQPMIARCYLVMDQQPEALAAYEKALEGQALPSVELELLEILAQAYVDNSQFSEAIAIYDRILQSSEDPRVLGRAMYKAGWAEILLGEQSSGYDRYLRAVELYPQAYESYLALVDLLEAGIVVGDYPRGLVDYFAKVYEPAVQVLSRFVEQNPSEPTDAYLYLAWSSEEIGDFDTAVMHVDDYIGVYSSTVEIESSEIITGDVSALARGWIEKAKLHTRIGDYETAVDSYLTYLRFFPDGEHAPFAAWWAAALMERLGDIPQATELFAELASNYPDSEDAAEALYRAGLLSMDEGLEDNAYAYWSRGANDYPRKEYGAACLVYLLKTGTAEVTESFETQASNLLGDTYYHLRAKHIASDITPFQNSEELDLSSDNIEQVEAEEWLIERLGLEADRKIADLSPHLANDERLIRGEKLWRLGLYEEAKRELESLRVDFADDALSSYQLALFFRDLGLYRSSILAASTILRLENVSIFEAPPYIGKLVYPVYFSDLILAEAENYGYDPLLQFALVRQESLYESFATSFAAARGLSQVIPDTGEYIADRLDWPDYQLEDLFKPYVGIAFGAYYLDQQLDIFNGDIPAALSAYNGGPGNAARWYAQDPADVDHYLEIVDFSETREYIKRIYAAQAIYSYLYGGE